MPTSTVNMVNALRMVVLVLPSGVASSYHGFAVSCKVQNASYMYIKLWLYMWPLLIRDK